MIIWGINANNHDASISVIDGDGNILFAGHAERYSRIKNDPHLNVELINDALEFGSPNDIIWFENPWGRKARYLLAGQFNKLSEQSPKAYLKSFGLSSRLTYSDHHLSHAAGGYFTSGFNEAVCVVIDAVGELTTASIWHANDGNLKKIWSLKYPHSLGLFYSAITDLVGLKPNEEEYILMGMSAYGDSERVDGIMDHLHRDFISEYSLKQKMNFHKGIRGFEYYDNLVKTDAGKFDLALSAQSVITHQILEIIEKAVDLTGCRNLVYSGGVALNCLANSVITDEMSGLIDRIWIMPNPGDAGNSLGAAASYLGKQLNWKNAFLGTEIASSIDPSDVVRELLRNGMCGIATGRAEFGPRALGNRSLIADPRGFDIKDKVNAIKRRQKFRPFAPAVLDRFASEHFMLPENISSIPYMQFVCGVKNPHQLPAITHVDGSARVQTISSHESLFLNELLERWNEKTGCPVLLNTSLNIKGEPLVNSVSDAKRFAEKYQVKVF